MLITQKTYEKPPSDIYTSVFADYVDLGEKVNPFARAGQSPTRPRIQLLFILNAKDKEGNYYRVYKEVTKSLAQASELRKVIVAMTGVEPTNPFNMETLIGKNNTIVVKQGVSQTGKPKVTIESFLPAKEAFAVPAGFIRAKDRAAAQAQGQGQTLTAPAATTSVPAGANTQAPAATAAAEDDMPF